MPSEVTPKVPERPSRRKTSELFPLSGSESGDIKANSEPPTPAGTPNVPTRRPILKAKTMTSFESGMDQESLPKVPLQRPVRRSTTEELNNVMNNTSKELEEIESLISKHNIHNVSRKKSPTSVEEGKVAAIHQNGQRSASDNKTSTNPSPLEKNEHEGAEGNESAISPSNLVNKSNNEVTEHSDSEDLTEKQKVHAALDNEAGDRSHFEEKLIPGDMKVQVDVSKDVEEGSLNALPPSGITESDDKAEKFTKHPESSLEELQKHQEQQEEKIFQNPTDEESTTSLNEKQEGKDNMEVNSQPQGPSDTETVIAATSSNVPSQIASEEENDVPVIPRSRPKKDFEAHVQKEELPNTQEKRVSEECDSTLISTEEESKIPKIPSERPKRRAPPPVPKKPSSRIAAFQEMLQKQQQQDLHNNGNSSATTASADIAKKHTDSSITSDTTKADFTSKLNGLFALPGMVNPGQLPPSLEKKLSSPDTESKLGPQDQSQAKTGPLGGTRRGRGPRGRKLPSKVASVEKIEEDDNTNKIEIFNNWNVSSSFSKEKVLIDTTPGEQAERALDEKEKLPANAESDPLSQLPQTNTVGNRKAISEESLSPSEAIANRDQNDTTEIQEQQMEDQMEVDMERELSGGYEDVDSALHSEEASFHSL
ncbi:CKB_HP2_G0025590.mRNA.1.CDS.1 [Saccharomyces cerevisiae]|nr:CKB_HP2_G0025590.mRNA.1.CDS.1 [Saccharomyces cerevisiae]CAI6457234.1 CKB_HP2_G0025590.mRNA.1.CDS.1 [Saccharomyces cerevisiae]